MEEAYSRAWERGFVGGGPFLSVWRVISKLGNVDEVGGGGLLKNSVRLSRSLY
jgi:hypothetical protein